MKKHAMNRQVFAFPFLVISIVFVVFPLILVLVYAFRDKDGNFTFNYLVQVFTDKSNYLLLLKTIGTALLATVICLLIAYPVAFVLSCAPFNKYAILSLLFIVPMWMNFVLRIYALQSLLNLIGIRYNYLAAIIGLVYDFLPFMILPIYTSLANLDKSYREASTDLGANAFRTFWRVTFPLSVPGIVSGVMMVFMPTFSAYAVTDILGNADSSLIGGRIAWMFSHDLWNGGSALSFVLLILVVLSMLFSVLMNKSKKKTLTGNVVTVTGGGRML